MTFQFRERVCDADVRSSLSEDENRVRSADANQLRDILAWRARLGALRDTEIGDEDEAVANTRRYRAPLAYAIPLTSALAAQDSSDARKGNQVVVPRLPVRRRRGRIRGH